MACVAVVGVDAWRSNYWRCQRGLLPAQALPSLALPWLASPCLALPLLVMPVPALPLLVLLLPLLLLLMLWLLLLLQIQGCFSRNLKLVRMNVKKKLSRNLCQDFIHEKSFDWTNFCFD